MVKQEIGTIRLCPAKAPIGREKSQSMLSKLVQTDQMAFYITKTDEIQIFAVGSSQQRMKSDLNGSLRGWRLDGKEFTAAVPTEADEIIEVSYTAVGDRPWDYVLAQDGIQNQGNTPPPINTVIDVIASADVMAVYRVGIENANYEADRKKIKRKISESSPYISGKIVRELQRMSEDDVDITTHQAYDDRREMLSDRSINDIALSASLRLVGPDAEAVAKELTSVLQPIGNRYYETVGKMNRLDATDVSHEPSTGAQGKHPRTTFGISRLTSNTSTRINVSPRAAAQVAIPAVSQLSDQAVQQLNTNPNPNI